MHKIKEMLHKDDEDTNVHHTSSSHSSSTSHEGGGIGEKIGNLLHHDKDNTRSSHTSGHHREGEFLSNRQFEQGHVHHGEIEHGGMKREALGHSHSHELGGHKHAHSEHQHLHTSGEHMHKFDEHGHSHEKHIMHDRAAMKDNNLYKAGVDPTMNREVTYAHSHDGGVERLRIDEGKVVKEAIKEVELHKIQPVIHRDREQKEIRHVVEPHKKVEIKDTEIHHRERDIDLGVRREASTLETSRSIGHAPHIESTREFLGKERQHQELPAKIEEHVHRKVEEHIHPVVYKEVLKPKVTEETHHIYEKVKEAPIETYEVKELASSRGSGLMEAEREFFSRESSRGIVLGEGHSCSCDVEHHHSHGHTHTHEHKGESLMKEVKDKSHKIKDKSHKKHKDPSHKKHKDPSHKKHKHHGGTLYDRSANDFVSAPMPMHSHVTSIAEPIIGHHQNIGAHHLPAAAIPAGHNTAYDAALCNQCTNNAVCSHSLRDAERMKTMNEKKMMKDEKLAEQQQRKLANSGHSTNVNVV